MSRKSYLILENGKVFEGKGFGAEKDAVGEIVFTTSMVGYLDTVTDPTYYGQVVVQTFPSIGNYGVVPAEFQSNSPKLKAYIVRNRCQEPSNFRCEGILDTFLKESGIPGLYDVDTRAITRIVREHGVMNCKITSTLDNLDKDLEEIKSYKITNAVESVTAQQVTTVNADNAKFNVALWDLGAKASVISTLTAKGFNVTAFPATATADELMASGAQGVVISNGPGNPKDNAELINQIKILCDKKVPMFGVGLGHQLIALAMGADTAKLKYGHRGANQPSVYTKTGKVYITSQNHGYVVTAESLPQGATQTFVNVNDKTCEGIAYADIPAMSVQFYPEMGGPLDTSFLYDEFMALANK
jgi:carbamoyl-phosphate synthase small subunit